MAYQAARGDALLVEQLDLVTVVFHRPSGQTHLLVEPASEIFAALRQEPLTLDQLRDALASHYDLDDPAALGVRVAELVDAGLVVVA